MKGWRMHTFDNHVQRQMNCQLLNYDSTGLPCHHTTPIIRHSSRGRLDHSAVGLAELNNEFGGSGAPFKGCGENDPLVLQTRRVVLRRRKTRKARW
jgi:hypothetical protein